MAADMLKKYEKKDWQEVIPDGNFPQLLTLHENKAYVRDILANTVQNTSKKEEYVDVASLSSDADFFKFQKAVNEPVEEVPTHIVIQSYIDSKGEDYCYQDTDHPVPALGDRTKDNVTVGREANANE